jgi:heme A synthase
LILGAAFRHSGLKLIPHLIGACVVTFMLLWTAIPIIKRHSNNADLRKPAITVLSLLGLQLVLGVASYFTRVVWNQGAPEPEFALVISTVSHVAVGALVLASTLVLAVQANRYLSIRLTEETSAHHEAISA